MSMKKSALAATQRASKPAFTPPSNAASSFVQLRRLEIERDFAPKKQKLDKAFLRPAASAPDLKPTYVSVQRPRGPRRHIESRNLLALDSTAVSRQELVSHTLGRRASTTNTSRGTAPVAPPTNWMLF